MKAVVVCLARLKWLGLLPGTRSLAAHRQIVHAQVVVRLSCCITPLSQIAQVRVRCGLVAWHDDSGIRVECICLGLRTHLPRSHAVLQVCDRIMFALVLQVFCKRGL